MLDIIIKLTPRVAKALAEAQGNDYSKHQRFHVTDKNKL